MIRSQVVRELIAAAVERLIDCEHPIERRTDRVPCQCARCGSVQLPEGLSWTLPTGLQSIAELIEAARDAEAKVDRESNNAGRHQALRPNETEAEYRTRTGNG